MASVIWVSPPQDILADPSFSRVLYIKGSPLEANTLWKARLQEAAALL